jgi:hypothetical protein
MALEKIHGATILAVAMTVAVVGALATSLLTANRSVRNAGNVKTIGVGVYWDIECTNNITSIDWGYLEPGDTTNVTVYISNEGNIPIILNMTKEKWNPPSASEHISLEWTREDYILNPGVAPAIITLTVSPDVAGVTEFSFDITITGTESTYA